MTSPRWEDNSGQALARAMASDRFASPTHSSGGLFVLVAVAVVGLVRVIWRLVRR